MKRAQKGFTLVEMLCTIVIMLLVSATVTVGIRLAVSNYASSITASESKVLCTTILDAVSDELRFCRIKDWDSITFTSARYNGTRYFDVDETGQVVVVPLIEVVDEAETEKLLPAKTYSNGMKAQLDMAADRQNHIVKVTVTITDSRGKELISHTRDVEILNVKEVQAES